MSNIAVIVGNPFAGSLDHALADAYASAARAAGGDVRVVDLAATEFELSPPMREHLRVDGPDDVDRLGMPVADMIRTIDWADHVVFVYPVWWGTFPAVLKGFIDRVFVSGTAFRYRDHGSRWDRLLAGRTARLIVTMDAPTVFNRIKYRRATEMAMRNPLLWFVQHQLWPHGNAPDVDDRVRTAWAEGYVAVNRTFGEAVLAELERDPGAAVLFHDYHLYLAPGLVRAQAPTARIAHFVHIPWPQPDAWGVVPLPMRRAIYEGMLASDVVGFHTARWRANFLRGCRETLGAEIDEGSGVVHAAGRRTLARVARLPAPAATAPVSRPGERPASAAQCQAGSVSRLTKSQDAA